MHMLNRLMFGRFCLVVALDILLMLLDDDCYTCDG